MKQATINTAEETLQVTSAGLVYGGLCLRIDGRDFPDDRWRDFVVVVLSWWSRALARILAGETGPIEVPFMDGPFRVELRQAGPGAISVAGIDQRDVAREMPAVEVDARMLAESVISAADSTMVWCARHDHQSGDTAELVLAVDQLRRSPWTLFGTGK